MSTPLTPVRFKSLNDFRCFVRVDLLSLVQTDYGFSVDITICVSFTVQTFVKITVTMNNLHIE